MSALIPPNRGWIMRRFGFACVLILLVCLGVWARLPPKIPDFIVVEVEVPVEILVEVPVERLVFYEAAPPPPPLPKTLYDCDLMTLSYDEQGRYVEGLPEDPPDLLEWELEMWEFSIDYCLERLEYPPALTYPFPSPILGLD
jgi:hypothetical protein